MNKKQIIFWLCLSLFCLQSVHPLTAGFIVDAFTTPTSVATGASVGQTVTGNGLLDGRREFNVTASLNVQTAALSISNGSLVYQVTPSAPDPLASLMLRYVDTSPSELLPAPGSLLIENVSATSAWNLLVTLKGTNLPGGTTYAPSISSGFNGNLEVPLSLFAGSGSLGTVTEIQFDFTNSAGGQISFGQISITAVPEPTTCLAIIGCSGAFLVRRMRAGRHRA